MRRSAPLALALFFAACSSMPDSMPDSAEPLPAVHTHPWHDTRHHTERGFRNVWEDSDEPPFLKAAGWGISFLLSSKEQQPAPRQPLRADALALQDLLDGDPSVDDVEAIIDRVRRGQYDPAYAVTLATVSSTDNATTSRG